MAIYKKKPFFLNSIVQIGYAKEFLPKIIPKFARFCFILLFLLMQSLLDNQDVQKITEKAQYNNLESNVKVVSL